MGRAAVTAVRVQLKAQLLRAATVVLGVAKVLAGPVSVSVGPALKAARALEVRRVVKWPPALAAVA